MPKLTIHRGPTLIREIELGEVDLRIGRGEENDVVLPDETKGVSRFHAELRREGGQYSLIDLNSQNGLWVGGRKVQKITLEAGVRVTLATYTLMLVAQAAAAETPAAQPGAVPQTTDTIVKNVDVRLETKEQPTAVDPPGPRPVRQVKPAKRSPSTTGGAPAPGLIAAIARLPKPILFGGTAVVMVLIMGLGQLFGPSAQETPDHTDVDEALRIEPRAQASNDEVKRQALNDAAALIQSSDFDNAIRVLDEALLAVPTDVALLELKAKATDAQARAAAAPPTVPPVTVLLPPPAQPPSRPRTTRSTAPTREPQPTVTRKPGESQAEWVARDRQIAARYEEAKSLSDARSLAAASGLLAEIQRDEPGYKDVALLLAGARENIRVTAQQALEAGVKLEASNDLSGALQQYERAAQIDESLGVIVQENAKRVRSRMRTEGADAFTRAKQYDALGRTPEAVALYDRAYRYLTDDEPNRKVAKDRLDVLRARQ